MPRGRCEVVHPLITPTADAPNEAIQGDGTAPQPHLDPLIAGHDRTQRGVRAPRLRQLRTARPDRGPGLEEREHKLGAWIGNQRSRAATLTPERVEQLSAIGMRWT
ncbi:helicase associated domain-containing protein [Streptomyces guryensis]|uniref:Helicase associated domain-containing protein n=1 Tax=Streptomyces guryensis TaxID=2886947 RepID=A0A9Q3ZAH2_9ACTN|nr:helicase associated domain-containing protein [Streptomyces guryensis]